MVDRVVKVNDHGLRIGDDHPRAKLTDREVDHLLELRESDPEFWSYARPAEAFDISMSPAPNICRGTPRNPTAISCRPPAGAN